MGAQDLKKPLEVLNKMISREREQQRAGITIKVKTHKLRWLGYKYKTA